MNNSYQHEYDAISSRRFSSEHPMEDECSSLSSIYNCQLSIIMEMNLSISSLV